MIIKDRNCTLEPPPKYDLIDVEAEGEYLILRYVQTRFYTDTNVPEGESTVRIFLNSTGREVARTESYYHFPPQPVYRMPRDFIEEPKTFWWKIGHRIGQWYASTW
jgi:hypothetical protein